VHIVNLEKTPEQLSTMLKRSGGARTVPQIFINDRHIGGCDDLHDLEAKNKLDPLLSLPPES
jgi:glutaredoxin 3